MDGFRNYHSKQDKPDSEMQALCVLTRVGPSF